MQDLISKNGYVRYFKIYNKLICLKTVNDIVSANNRQFVKSNPEFKDGAWKVPSYMFKNIQNKQNSDYKYADLVSHAISVIFEQDYKSENLEKGSPFGKNDFRKLKSVDYGKAGSIKEYNENWSLFISLINQESVTVFDVLDFMREQYELFLASIYNYGVDRIPSSIANGSLNVSLTLNNVNDTHQYLNGVLKSNTLSIAGSALQNFYDFYRNENSLIVNSRTTADDDTATVLNDSTSVFPNFILTLPMIGLADLTKPEHGYDSRIGMPVIVHHDGHFTEGYTPSIEVMKKLADTFYLRSNGQKTPGVVTNNLIPQKPFAKQFWFDTCTNRLFMYSVDSDTITNEPEKSVGKFWYLRDDDKLLVCLEKNGALRWYDIESGDLSPYFSKNDPWVEFRMDVLINSLIYSVETNIYDEVLKRSNNVKTVSQFTYDSMASNTSFARIAKSYFLGYARKYSLDPYDSEFDENNPFTWNYGDLGEKLNIRINDTYVKTWYDIYYAIFGTARPDVEPWIILGKTRDTFISELSANNIDEMTAEMWEYVKTQWGGKFEIPVDFTSNNLIPPYGPTGKYLTNEMPKMAFERFEFGDNGPIEMGWINSIEFKYDIAKIAFRLYPLDFISKCWGYKNTVLNNGYEIDSGKSKKLSNKDFYLHGDVTENLHDRAHLISATVNYVDGNSSPIYVEMTAPNYFSVSQAGRDSTYNCFSSIGEIETDLVDAKLAIHYNGLSIGDRLKINVDEFGTIISSQFIPAMYVKLHGLAQTFAQLLKYKSIHYPTTSDYAAFKNWDIDLGYGFTTLVNTDSVDLKIDSGYLSPSEDFTIALKKTVDVHRFPFTAFYCQLVEKGSYNIDQHGNEYPLKAASDWIFKIDGFNSEDNTITVKTFNFDSDRYHMFYPLDGVSCKDQYVEYYEISGEQTYTLPILISGAQNVVNFVLGYAAKLTENGFKFNNSENSLDDATSGKMNGWRTEVEKMLDQLWKTTRAGDGFVFNPFKGNLFFTHETGMLSSLVQDDKNSSKLAYVADIAGKRITEKYMRVFRNEYSTEVISDAHIYSGKITIDEYEHVVLFSNKSYTTNTILFDPILGIKVPRMLVDVKKQLYLSQNMSFGGNYLSNNKHRTNVEASVKNIENYYDSSASLPSDVLDRVRSLFGYNSSFLKNMDINPKTKFEFWKGMIKNKGSNLAIDAFTNSKSFDNIVVDEYWMHKVATYGDGINLWIPEIKVTSEMLVNDKTSLYFLEKNEIENEECDISVEQNNDSIFYSYDDLNRNTYFEAELISTVHEFIDEDHTGVVDVVDADSRLFADYVELWCDGKLYSIYLAGWDTAKYDRTAWDDSDTMTNGSDIYIELINCTTAKIKDTKSFIGKTIEIRAYGFPKTSVGPFEIFDYKNTATISNSVILWHPAAGVYDAYATKNICVEDKNDPAIYNASRDTMASGFSKMQSWGENEIGRIWFNTDKLDYLPYYDQFLIPDLGKRISMWGALAEYSKYEVYQWGESDVTPVEHNKKFIDGVIDTKPAMKTLFKAQRNWNYTPIAWKHSKNPKLAERKFNESLDSIQLKTPSEAGSLIAVDNHPFSYNGINSENTTIMILSDDAESIVGEYRLTEFDRYYVVGTDSDFFMFNTNSVYFRNVTVDINESDSGILQNSIGRYKFSTELISDIMFIKAINVKTGDVQKIVLKDTENLIGSREVYYFDRFGFSIKFINTYDHSSIEFSNYDVRKTAIENLFKNMEFSIREALWVDTIIPGKAEIIGSHSYISFRTPSKEELETDPVCPGNMFEPVYFNEITLAPAVLDLHRNSINDDIKNKVEWQAKNIGIYRYDIDSWKKQSDRFVKAKFKNENDFKNIFSITSEESANSTVKIYVNGTKTSKFTYSLDLGNTQHIKMTTLPNVGDTVVMIVVAPIISKEQLDVYEKAGTSSDSADTNVFYKYDYDFCKIDKFDETTGSMKSKYYFWMSGDNMISPHGMTVGDIKARLEKYLNPFSIVTHVDGKFGDLPVRYKGLTFVNLKYAVDKANTYKVKLNKFHRLRKFETDLEHKNIHTEWKLMKKTMVSKVPAVLWDKFVDSIVGETLTGEILPEPTRVRYDKKHSTTVKYGFGAGQVLFDSCDAKILVTSYIQKINKYIDGGISIDGFDIHDFLNNIDDVTKTRNGLNALYANLNAQFINELFFDIIELGLTYNYVFTDFVKTSFISVVSSKELKVFN